MASIEILAKKFGIGIKKVIPSVDCELCISGYTGKRCKYLIKINNEYYCIREAIKGDNRLGLR